MDTSGNLNDTGSRPLSSAELGVRQFGPGGMAELTKPPVRFSHPASMRVSRSPSHSPSRRHRSGQDTHHLGAELSPESTLDALTRALSAWADGQESSDPLSRSIARADPVERAVAVRVSMASKQLRHWHAEVSTWEWPVVSEAQSSTGFEVPTLEERARKRRKTSEDTHEHMTSLQAPYADLDWVDEEYWGGCPARLVRQRQDRIDIMRDGIDELELEDLKSHVLDAHNPSRSRPSSSYERQLGVIATGVAHLDDMTAITTATLLQALPCLARLLDTLETWSARLAVLRMIPAFLEQVQDTQVALESAWRAIGPRSGAFGGTATRPGSDPANGLPRSDASSTQHASGDEQRTQTESNRARSDLTRAGLAAIQAVLAGKVASLGRKLDRMLDALEGREDTIPNDWIEEMEMLERDYGDWVFEAENVVLQNELRDARNRAGPEAPLTSEKQPMHHQVAPEGAASVERGSSAAYEPVASVREDPSPVPDAISESSSPTGAAAQRDEGHRPNTSTRLPEPSTPTSRPKHPSRGLSEPGPAESSQTQNIIIPTTSPSQTRDPAALAEETPIRSSPAKNQKTTTAPGEAEGDKPLPSETKVNRGSFSKTPTPPRPTIASRSKSAPAVPPLTPSSNEITDLPETGYDLGFGGEETEDGVQPDCGSRSSLPDEHKSLSELVELANEAHAEKSLSGSEGQVLQQAPTAHADGDLDHTSIAKHGEILTHSEPDHPPSELIEANDANHIDDLGSANADQRDGGTSVPGISEHAVAESLLLVETPVPASRSSQLAPASLEARLGSAAQESLALRRLSSRSAEKPRTTAQESTSVASALEDPSRLSRLLSSRVPAPINVGGPTAEAAVDPLSASSLISDLSSPELRDALAAVSYRPIFVDTTPLTSVGLSGSNKPQPSVEAVGMQADHWPGGSSTAKTKSHRRSFSVPNLGDDEMPSELVQSSPARSKVSVDDLGILPSRRASIASVMSMTSEDRQSLETVGVRRRSSLPSSTPTARRGLKTDSNFEASTPSGRVKSSAGSPLASRSGSSPKSPRRDTALRESPKVRSQRDAHLTTSLRGSPKSKSADEGRRKAGTSQTAKQENRDTGKANADKPHEANLEDKISSILTTIPAHIRLTSTPDADLDSGTRDPATSHMTPSTRPRRNTSTSDSYVLAPAAASNSSSHASSGKQEGKLYHLRRSGAEVPIKLFVRLVGPHNERVMVRVGGGWSELGEYLRDYALHHSRRSSSDVGGLVEVTRLPSGTPSSARAQQPGEAMTPETGPGAGNTGSRPSSVLGRSRPSPITPHSSSLAVRKTRPPSHTPSTPTASQVTASIAPLDDTAQLPTVTQSSSPSSSPPTSPVLTSAPPLTNDIRQRDSNANSQNTDGKRRVSRRTEPLSAEKQAWVDDMMSKVRRGASATFQTGGGGSGQGTPTSITTSANKAGRTTPTPNNSSTIKAGRTTPTPNSTSDGATPPHINFGELGTVGRTRRLFRKDTQS